MTDCDCLIHCGDDPWLKDGRAQPCQAFLDRQRKAEIFSSKLDRSAALCVKYGVRDFWDLADVMETRIQQLEAKAQA